ncbi:MAG: hypothetical protein AAGA29_14075 [Planctomycetota bacterium]
MTTLPWQAGTAIACTLAFGVTATYAGGPSCGGCEEATPELEENQVVLVSQRGLQGASQSYALRIDGEDHGSAAGSADWRIRMERNDEGVELMGFCVEPGSGLGGNQTPYEVVDLYERLHEQDEENGVERAMMLAKWFGAYYGGHDREDWERFGSMNKYQVIRAFQLGVWEIMYEDFDAIGDLAGGSFQAVVDDEMDEKSQRTQERTLASAMFATMDFNADTVADATLVMLVSEEDDDLGEEFQDQVVMLEALPLEVREQFAYDPGLGDDAVASVE